MPSYPIQSYTRQTIRERIGRNLNDVIIGTASTTGTGSTLIDTFGLQKGGTDEHKGYQLLITAVASTANSAHVGAEAWVTAYAAASTCQITFTPALSAGSTLLGHQYELWRTFTSDEINAQIDDAVSEVTAACQQVKQTANTWTEKSKYTYNCLSGFSGLHTVEYVSKMDSEVLDNCDVAWVAVNNSVSLDDELVRRGSYCNKFWYNGDPPPGSALVGTRAITSNDLSDYDEVELWIRSNTSLAASALEFVMGGTVACVTPTERRPLPALSADTWTRCELALTAIESNTAIISIGLAHTASMVDGRMIWVDYVIALNSSSRVFKELSPQQWKQVKAATTTLKLTPDGITVTKQDTLLRLTGYANPALMTADSAVSEVDPRFITAYVTGKLLTGHAKSALLDIEGKPEKAAYWNAEAARIKREITTQRLPNTRWL